MRGKLAAATGLVLVALCVAGCEDPASPVTPAGSGSGGGSGGGSDGGSGGGGSGGGSGDGVTAEGNAPHGNGAVHSPINFDPTIPQFQPLYGQASFSEFKGALWTYFDGLCSDRCGIQVVAEYQCADQQASSCTVDHVDYTNPVASGDTITVVLTDSTSTDTDTDTPDSPDDITTTPTGE